MAMKKFINDSKNLTRELLEGLAIAHGDQVVIKSEKIVCRAVPKAADKVALVTLGGAGHEPALSGFVGEGMLDYSVVGDIFAAPGPPKVIEALRLANRPAGVLFVVLNHAGDVMSANLAMEMAEKEGLNVRMLLTHEDIAPGSILFDRAPVKLPHLGHGNKFHERSSPRHRPSSKACATA